MAKKNKDAVKPSEVIPQTSPKKLKALLKTAEHTKTNMQELAGELGQQIKDAVEKDHLHRKAFSVLRTMDRMTPEKLADFWDTLQYYVDVSGIGERAKSAPRMAFDAEGNGEDDEAEGAKGNVTGFPASRSQH